MASSHVASSSSSRINEKHKVVLNEMKKELHAAVAVAPAVGGNLQAAQTTTKVSMMNNGVDAIKFHEKKDWSGSMLGYYPTDIDINRSGKFSHRGTPPSDVNGSMGAIVYVGPNVQGGSQDECAWVFAWSVPGDGSSENKVYVETGPASRYPKNSIPWDPIKDKLLKASYECQHSDDNSHTAISASIDQTGNTPALAAVFDVTF